MYLVDPDVLIASNRSPCTPPDERASSGGHTVDGIGIADYLIAGTADIRGLQLATLNVRHSRCSRTSQLLLS
jgi:predicted nucleic acid-binding protein